MKIGIMSDLHGYPDAFRKAVKIFEGCDMILCAGDVLYHGPRNPILEGYNPKELVEEIRKNEIPMLIARGNCDAEVDMMVLDLPIMSEYIVYEKEGIRFIVTHGHSLNDDKLKEIGKTYKAQFVVSGHTHIRTWEKHLSTLYLNPGSISVPKGDGIPSVVLYDNGALRFYNVENGSKLEEVSTV